MRKGTIIATCLKNSGMDRDIKRCENAVQNVFISEFPNADYMKWNTDVDDKFAAHIIKTVGRASTIRIDKFIQDLW